MLIVTLAKMNEDIHTPHDISYFDSFLSNSANGTHCTDSKSYRSMYSMLMKYYMLTTSNIRMFNLTKIIEQIMPQ